MECASHVYLADLFRNCDHATGTPTNPAIDEMKYHRNTDTIVIIVKSLKLELHLRSITAISHNTIIA